MTFEVIFTVSQPLNFLGYARNRLQNGKGILWSRDVEALFAYDNPVDTVLSHVPLHIRAVIQEYRDPFLREWPSIREELLQVKERFQAIWNSNSQKVGTLMDGLGFFYSDTVEVFPVMPFFREWPRSNPLSMPAMQWTDREVLEYLVHEILHRTSDTPHPQSLWRCLSMIFFMKKVPKERRFLIQHALIYVAAAWITSRALQEEFVMPHLKQVDSQIEQCMEMGEYMHSIFRFFSSMKETEIMKLAENIVACCISE